MGESDRTGLDRRALGSANRSGLVLVLIVHARGGLDHHPALTTSLDVGECLERETESCWLAADPPRRDYPLDLHQAMGDGGLHLEVGGQLVHWVVTRVGGGRHFYYLALRGGESQVVID